MRRAIRNDEAVTEAIVRAVADKTGRGPTELQPIAEEIDPDAVDDLFTRSPEGGPDCLQLLYEGCRVRTDGETVIVEAVEPA